jgi:DNA-binding LacI/PurR family transcriptional regulator
MVDVAKAAGVSLKSVSNYFNEYPHMTPQLRSRIERAVEQLDYRVNGSARSLRSGSTGSIALVVPELAQPYFAELAQDVVKEAQAQGVSVSVEVTEADGANEYALITGARGPFVDGIIFEAVAMGQDDIPFDKVRVPLVLIGERATGQAPSDFVTMNNLPAAFDATAHLIGRGSRRIVALGATDADYPSAYLLRLQGYQRALEVAGLMVDPALVLRAPAWRTPEGISAITGLIASGVEFDAVFGFNDALALGALIALQRAGRSVPGEVAVVGFDNLPAAEYTYPALTTIDPGRQEIARLAVDLLLERIHSGADGRAPQRITVPHTLVVRETT